MRNIVIFDFEVFKHDTLLGARLLIDDKILRFQSWDLDEIRRLYENCQNFIWIGHNNAGYDNFILQAIVKGANEEDVKKVNDNIILRGKKPYLTIPLVYYDLISSHVCQLKAVEAFVGKNISESEVDFNLDRKLTEDEKRKTEKYNNDDLDQTYDDFNFLKAEFDLRLEIINEFKLPMSCLSMTGTRVAEEVLHAKKIEGIEKWYKAPTLWPNLRVKNQEVIDFYLSEEWRNGATLDITLCGTPHKLAAGGIHGCKRKFHRDWCFYFDVSGYYNLIMILLDLLPRSIDPEYRKYYKEMYEYQLTLKKIDPHKRSAYKTILLSVFGAMNNEYCRFYDPYHGDLVRLSGEMFLVDLLEKLEGKAEVAQSNTDGIIAYPINGTTEQQLIDIINEWQNRTGFVLKLEKIYDLHQRDVNCYMYKDADGYVHTLGEAVKDYGKWEYPFWKDSFKSKEPMIISTAICEYYMNHKLPEEVIKENENNLRMFQYVCKKQSFDYMEYEARFKSTGVQRVTQMQHVNRAFALNSTEYDGMLYKRKWDGKKAKVSNLPDSVFVYNNEILSDKAISEVKKQIDYDYYIRRAYERIVEFVELDWVNKIA